MKKILSIILCLLLVMAMLPTTALAGSPVASGTCGAAGNESNVTWVLDDSGTLTISGTGAMEEYAFDSALDESLAPWYAYRDQITSMVFSGVTNVGSSSAYLLTGLTSVTLPDSILSIGHGAFSKTGISSVTIPDSVSSIGVAAFANCDSLTSVALPASVTTLPYTSFANCAALTELTFHSLPVSVASGDYGATFWQSPITKVKYLCSIDEADLKAKLTLGGVSEAAVYELIHSWDEGTVTRQPTIAMEGVETFTCILCAETKTKPIARLAGKTISFGADGIGAGDKIYFGKYAASGAYYDVPWVVLSEGSGSAFLLSEYLLGNSQFQASGSGYYKGSTLNAKMDELYNSDANTLFTSNERGLIVAKTNLNCVDGQYDDQSSPVVPTAYLYPLSYNEAAAQSWGSAKYRNDGSTGSWWLRSSMMDDEVYCVSSDRPADASRAQRTYGVRPAMNLNTSEVLFTSAAVGGKTANGMESALTEVSATTSTDWKLTLLDNGTGSGREDFAITTTALSATSATVDYTDAKTGTNEYISAVIVDNGSVAYYGRIKSLPNTADASGTVTINIPSGVTLDTDTQLKVFNEQFNGDRSDTDDTAMAYTDYASELKTVSAPVPVNAAPTASNVSMRGLFVVGETLTGVYTYSDIDGDLEGTSTFRWYRSDSSDGFNKAPIAGANAKTYVLTGDDEGKYISFEVTPAAMTGITQGSPAESGTIGTVAPAPIVTSVTVSPAVASVAKGGTAIFTATVGGANNPAQTVTWTVEGKFSASTTISTAGVLSVGADETASVLAVRATSLVDTSKFGTATVTVMTSPAPPDPNPIQYQITKGQNGKWTKGDSNGLSFTADADYSKFIDVSVDGSTISSDKFNSESGSTIITLKASYLQTLSVGQHMLRINFTDGYAETSFTIKNATDTDVPTTGDNSQPWLWLGVALLAGACLIGSFLVYKKKRQTDH